MGRVVRTGVRKTVGGMPMGDANGNGVVKGGERELQSASGGWEEIPTVERSVELGQEFLPSQPRD